VAFGEPPRPEVRAMWAQWERRCRFVSSELDAIPGVTCRPPEGGYYAWPDVSATGWSDVELSDALLTAAHVAVLPGSVFGPSGAGFLRITCVRSWSQVEEALARIRALLSAGRKPVPAMPARCPRGHRRMRSTLFMILGLVLGLATGIVAMAGTRRQALPQASSRLMIFINAIR
jgi:hypothetical protein